MRSRTRLRSIPWRGFWSGTGSGVKRCMGAIDEDSLEDTEDPEGVEDSEGDASGEPEAWSLRWRRQE